MAVTDWPQTWTITNGVSTSSTTWPVIFTSGGANSGSYIYSGGGYSASPAPHDPTALDWLDSEVEKVCELARLAG